MRIVTSPARNLDRMCFSLASESRIGPPLTSLQCLDLSFWFSRCLQPSSDPIGEFGRYRIPDKTPTKTRARLNLQSFETSPIFRKALQTFRIADFDRPYEVPARYPYSGGRSNTE